MKYLAYILALVLLSPVWAQEDTSPLVQIVESEELGAFLADAEGMTLYIFLNDEPGVSNCTGGCLENWPPLLISDEAELVAPEGLMAELGTIDADDGMLHVTYDGMPLYFWVNDAEPGDTTGHEVGNVWLVASVEPMEEEASSGY